MGFTNHTFRSDTAAMGFNELPGNGKPDSGASGRTPCTGTIGTKEPFENIGQIGLRNTISTVLKIDLDPFGQSRNRDYYTA